MRKIKNGYEVRGSVTAIYVRYKSLTLETLIDTDDLPKLLNFKYSWYVHKVKGQFIVKCSVYKGRNIRLPRFIIEAPDELVVDHINHNTLDNRKSNLRLATNAENSQNRVGAAKHSKSKIRGVMWDKRRCKWYAAARINGKEHFAGRYDCKSDAETAVKSMRARLMPFSLDALEQKENRL